MEMALERAHFPHSFYFKVGVAVLCRDFWLQLIHGIHRNKTNKQRMKVLLDS